MAKEGYHFVLVHGAGHGAWCWYKVVTILKSAGCRATAIDLAASGINLQHLEDVPLLSDYLEPLMAFIEALAPGEKVVLVGRSLGGVAVSVAMERFPGKVSAGVFVTAYMPGPELSLVEIRKHGGPADSMDNKYEYSQGPQNPPTALLFGPRCLSTFLYQLSPPEDLILATLLVRFSPLYNDPKSYEEIALTKENFGSVYRVYIVSCQDLAIGEKQQRWMIEKNPPDEVKEISESDHMVMFSKPKELCSHLLAIADKFNS